MRLIYSIFIFSLSAMLPGCSDNESNSQTASIEYSVHGVGKKKSSVTINTEVTGESSEQAPDNTISSKKAADEAVSDKENIKDNSISEKSKIHPYLALQYKKKNAGEIYACSMHSSVVSDHEGDCSICGMHLVKQIEQSESSVVTLPKKVMADIDSDKKVIEEVRASKPKLHPYTALQYKRKTEDDEDNQPVTVRLERATADAVPDFSYSPVNAKVNKPQQIKPIVTASNEKASDFFVCPMHPAVVSDHKANCPICGMHLVKQEAKNDFVDESNSIRLSSGVVQKIGVRTASVVNGLLRKTLKTAGNVGYNEKRLAHVISQTYGWVENLSLRRTGLPVKRGELLMEIYSPEYLKAQKEFLRTQKIDKSAGQLKKYAERDETVPAREYLRYLQIPESAINELVRSGTPRLRIPVYAPQYGEVIALNVKKHSYINEGQIMLTIADFSSVWVEVNVFQHQLEWLRRNQEAEIVVDVLPGQRLKGRVDAIDPELDPRTHTVKVRILIGNPDDVLRPNMYAQVTIFDNAQKEILKIPREALIETGNRTSVIKALGDGLFMPVDVIAGLHSGGEVEIKSGLHEGDLVVTSGQFLIDSEANLRASFRRLGHAREVVSGEHAEEAQLDGKE